MSSLLLCVVVSVVVVVVLPLVSLFLIFPPLVWDVAAGARSLLSVAAGEGNGKVRYRTNPGS